MPIRFQCPHCLRTIAAADEQAGQHVHCPACAEQIDVPPLRGPRQQPVAKPPSEPPLVLRTRPALDDGMDMTPMVDVTFLLLIFFMVTAAFALQKSIEIPPSEQEATAGRTQRDFEQDTQYVVVRVDSDNVFWISSATLEKEQEAHSEPDLLIKLREARDAASVGYRPNKLLVMASGDARHEYVVKALDAGTAVGMEEIRLSTFEDDE